MDLDWCIVCDKRSESGAAYCSDACRVQDGHFPDLPVYFSNEVAKPVRTPKVYKPTKAVVASTAATRRTRCIKSLSRPNLVIHELTGLYVPI